MLLRHIKRRLFGLLNLDMLISRKVTQDKRVVTYFRHLNIKIAKNNLAFLLLKDTFSVLGSSRCKVLSVLDLKDAFHSLRLLDDSKKYCGILPYFSSTSYLYQRIPIGLNISPLILQSYINTILDCFQSRKYCEAIMDDLLLFTPSKGSQIAKLEDLLKAFPKNGLKFPQSNVPYLEQNYSIWAIQFLLKTDESA